MILRNLSPAVVVDEVVAIPLYLKMNLFQSLLEKLFAPKVCTIKHEGDSLEEGYNRNVVEGAKKGLLLEHHAEQLLCSAEPSQSCVVQGEKHGVQIVFAFDGTRNQREKKDHKPNRISFSSIKMFWNHKKRTALPRYKIWVDKLPPESCVFLHLQRIPKVKCLWGCRDVPIYEVSDSLGPYKCNVLLVFHAWSNLCNESTQIFIHPITNPSMLHIDSHSMRMIEKFTVIQYGPICAATGVNEAILAVRKVGHLNIKTTRRHAF